MNDYACRVKCLRWVFAVSLCLLAVAAPHALAQQQPKHTAPATQPNPDDVVQLRAYGVPSNYSTNVFDEATRLVMDAFREKYPTIDPISTTGLNLPGGRAMDMVPFMQIAGDLAPDAMYVNFRQSNTYIGMKLLYPLDQYIEQMAQATVRDGSAMSTPQYIEALKKGRNWAEVEERMQGPIWEVVRRQCPHGDQCWFRAEQGLEPLADHYHVWTLPVGPLVMGVKYDRTVLAEHLGVEGIEMRAPRDWEELLRWCKEMTNPANKEYGINISSEVPSWHFLTFLYSAGGRVVEKRQGETWECVLDSEAAVEAAYFYARLKHEKVRKANGEEFRGVMAAAGAATAGTRYAFEFMYLSTSFLNFGGSNPDIFSVGPVPAGPGGNRGSEFNSKMMGIFVGLADKPERRDAAWKYITFFDGPEAQRIRTDHLVRSGQGRFVRPRVLQQFNEDGRYNDILRQIPAELEEAYQLALEGGVPEPYGKNCQYIYNELNKPIGEIWRNPEVLAAIDANDPERGKRAIRPILAEATRNINEKMLGNLSPQENQRRNWISWAVIAVVMVIFYFVLRKVFRTFAPPEMSVEGRWQFRRYRVAYLLMAPALLTIALWAYWPLARGGVIAFQDYSVVGDTTWTGAQNFASVLFDHEFWHSLGVSLLYALMFMVFGFWAPITLAFLLQEVPRGSIVFRTIYYLPAVLTGVVVIFLWKSFYAPDGLINQILNGLIWVSNSLFGTEYGILREQWLENEYAALFLCLLPTVWAGMGPGCLIYLAALKTIPEELYEAADIDGATISNKVFSVALPSIKALVSINFIGAMIGEIRGAGGFILAMTGGGPFTADGGATEVIGLRLFYTTFGYLKFGVGAAMAWVLGAMLIGFTVIQLQRLSKLEFRTVQKAN